MSNHATLEAATQDRKARLAQLKSLKRKQPQSDTETSPVHRTLDDNNATALPPSNKRSSRSRSPSPSVADIYLSGRNYDVATRGPRLGFEKAPTDGQKTLEEQAKQLADTTRKLAREEEAANKPLDLFKLQPKRPNWDLKRDLHKKLEPLNIKTDNAIARIVRERTEKAQAEAKAANRVKNNGEAADGDGEAIGMEGSTLVTAMRELEREEAEEQKKDEAHEDAFT